MAESVSSVFKEAQSEAFNHLTMRKLMAEFIGTFFLVFTVGCNVAAVGEAHSQGVFVAISIGSVLMITIYGLGPVSGANFNPAVTVGVCMAGKMSAALGILYVAVQIFAGVIAAFSFTLLYDNEIQFGPNEKHKFNATHALICEFLYTFMLVFTVLNTACVKEGNQYFGLSIGFVIVAGGNAAGWISGGAFNPAVAVGLDVAAPPTTGWSLPYVLVELFAGAVAAAAFRFLRSKEYGDEVSEDKELVIRCTAEFIGTFFLVLTVGLNVLKGGVMDPEDPMNEAAVFSIAASLMVMIYDTGSISGGHLNPAVTAAVFAAGRNNITRNAAGCYMASQICGGVFASFIYSSVTSGSAFDLGPYGSFTWSGVIVAEFVFTFLLCFIVLTTATVKNMSHSKDIFGLAIGFSVVVGGYAIGPISGANLNPAVSWGIDTSYAMAKGGSWGRAISYSIIQLIAGVASALVFRVVFPDEYDGIAATPDQRLEDIGEKIEDLDHKLEMVINVLKKDDKYAKQIDLDEITRDEKTAKGGAAV